MFDSKNENTRETELKVLPRHVAIIMDGNGRWAAARGLPRLEGHKAGHQSVRIIVRLAHDLGLTALTLYVFSSENWQRPDEEVEGLMFMIEQVAKSEIDELNEKGVKVCPIGRLNELPDSLRAELERDHDLTKNNTGLILNLAINYGGRCEIADAARQVAQMVAKGCIKPSEITEELFSHSLYNPEVADPDLLIRTGGEMRISNFLLWQVAYSELVFTPVLWPDFREPQFLEALEEYSRRERRFGDVKSVS